MYAQDMTAKEISELDQATTEFMERMKEMSKERYQVTVIHSRKKHNSGFFLRAQCVLLSFWQRNKLFIISGDFTKFPLFPIKLCLLYSFL